MSFWRKQNVVSGAEGKLFMSYEGRKIEVAGVREVDATESYNKEEVRAVGQRMVGNKITSSKGEGSLKVYYITSEWRKLSKLYKDTGMPFTFDLNVTNDDPASGIGRQTTAFFDCTFDEMPLALLNADDEILEEDLSFTFDDYDILEEFSGDYNRF